MTNIYSDIQAYIMTSESGDTEVFIIDRNGSSYNPNLILPNLLAAKRLYDYLGNLIAQNPKYFKLVGEHVSCASCPFNKELMKHVRK